MKAVLVAMFAFIGLAACGQKTPLKQPASPDVQPTVEKQAAIPGPAAATGQASGKAEKSDPDQPGDTVLVLPEKR